MVQLRLLEYHNTWVIIFSLPYIGLSSGMGSCFSYLHSDGCICMCIVLYVIAVIQHYVTQLTTNDWNKGCALYNNMNNSDNNAVIVKIMRGYGALYTLDGSSVFEPCFPSKFMELCMEKVLVPL